MRIIIFFILLFLPLAAFPQKEDYNWIMGLGQADLPSGIHKLNQIRFENDTFSVSSLLKSNPFFGACAVISDSAGNLMCYSNGINVYSRNHLIMQGGQSFQMGSQYPFGYPFNQSVLLLPLPDTSGIYIMIDGNQIDITTDIITERLRYSLIDIKASNGLGRVNAKMETIENTTDTLNIGFLTALRHANGKDWWILVNKFESNQYRKFIIDKSGIHYIDDQVIGEIVHNGVGYAAYSPSGCWYAHYVAYGQTFDPHAAIYFYRFDRQTGALSDPAHKMFPGPYVYGGVAFSPNSRYMYVSIMNQVLQYDLHADDILASETVVAEYDGFLDEQGVPTRFYGLQLAPDNKIYGNIPNTNSRYLHVIDQPDLPGAACNVIQHAIYLPAHNFGTLPNLPFYRLYEATVSCDSLISSAAPLPPAQTRPAIRVWPVPAADVLYFSADAPWDAPLRLILFDAMGRPVLERRDLRLAPTAAISLGELASGAYFYTLLAPDGTAVKSGKAVRTR